MPLPNASRPRIVTYSPALTQMAVDMGLGSHIVGVTSQCTVPADLHPLAVGDALRPPGVEAILSVQPDVVLIQVDPSGFEPLRKVAPKIRIEHFTIENLADIPLAVERLGKICGRPDAAKAALKEWQANLDAADQLAGKLAPASSTSGSSTSAVTRATAPAAAPGKPPRVLFVMGYSNPSTGGAGTFISDMIERAGGANAAADLKRWSPIGLEYAMSVKADVVVCLLDSATQNAEDAKAYWQPVLRAGARWVVLSDRKWTIPGLHTAEYVRQLAAILHGADGDAP
jgi:iron complex transport system substrate-binding protein